MAVKDITLKAEAVRRMHSGELSAPEAAAYYGVSDSTVRKWASDDRLIELANSKNISDSTWAPEGISVDSEGNLVEPELPEPLNSSQAMGLYSYLKSFKFIKPLVKEMCKKHQCDEKKLMLWCSWIEAMQAIESREADLNAWRAQRYLTLKDREDKRRARNAPINARKRMIREMRRSFFFFPFR